MYRINLIGVSGSIDVFADSFDLVSDSLENLCVYFYDSGSLVCSFPATIVSQIFELVNDGLESVFVSHVSEGVAL